MKLRDMFMAMAEEYEWDYRTQVDVLLRFIEEDSGLPRLAFTNFLDQLAVEMEEEVQASLALEEETEDTDDE